MAELGRSEYEALRATIRERGTMRVGAVLAGLSAWGALAIALSVTASRGGIALVPLVVLAATFEVSFFIHTGVERIGRYIQVFHEETTASEGWETIAMQYGSKFPGGLDPLFTTIFWLSAATNLVTSIGAQSRAGWIVVIVFAHLTFAYRIVTARSAAATQRARDLDRYRQLRGKDSRSE